MNKKQIQIMRELVECLEQLCNFWVNVERDAAPAYEALVSISKDAIRAGKKVIKSQLPLGNQ